MLLAQSFRYKSMLKETSPFESMVFLVLAGVLVLVIVFWIIWSRRREGRQLAASLLAGCIRTSRLNLREGELLRALAGREGVRQVLKNRESFNGAMTRYLESRRAAGADAAQLDQERQALENAGRKIHFLKGRHFATDMLRPGASVRLRIHGAGLFTGIIATAGRRGTWISLPHWILPGGAVRKRQEAVLYHMEEGKDYEVHARVEKVRGRRPLQVLLSAHNTVYQGRHPGGAGIEAELPVHFRRILEVALPDEERPQLHVLQGSLACVSVAGVEILSRTGGQPGAVYRFELSRQGTGRRIYWFNGRVLAADKEGAVLRLFVMFLEMHADTRGLIDRLVSRQSVPAGGISGEERSADIRPGS